jgi:hypothetical protein
MYNKWEKNFNTINYNFHSRDDLHRISKGNLEYSAVHHIVTTPRIVRDNKFGIPDQMLTSLN